jgi:hypothetical protein
MEGQDPAIDGEFVVTRLTSTRPNRLDKTPDDLLVNNHRGTSTIGNRRTMEQQPNDRQAKDSAGNRSQIREARDGQTKTSDHLRVNDDRGNRKVNDRQADDRRDKMAA